MTEAPLIFMPARNRLVIQQQIEIKPWPDLKVGDKKFFGYVVAIGVHVVEWGSKYVRYVDFAYRDEYDRYQLPDDGGELAKQLSSFLLGNIKHADEGSGIYGKLWITKTLDGWGVDLP